MKTYQVNHASWKEGPFGDFGSLLANPLGHTETQAVDKIVIRCTKELAEKISEKLKALKGSGMILTATAEFQPVALKNGDLGFTREQWEDKRTGENREQASLYIRFATTPAWATAQKPKVDEIGNLGDI